METITAIIRLVTYGAVTFCLVAIGWFLITVAQEVREERAAINKRAEKKDKKAQQEEGEK